MSNNGSGYVPVITVAETTKSNGKTFINIKIQVGNKYIKFDPTHWDDLVASGNIITDAAIQRRYELVDMARDLYEE